MKKENKLVIKIQRLLKKLNQREYLHHFGPKKYKLKHHLTALIVMQICKLSLRRVENFLILFGIKVPTYSALCKSRKRIPFILWQRLLYLTSGLSSGEVAPDGTGFSRINPSFHYLKRINSENPKGYAKLSVLFDIKTKKFLAMKIRVKPRHDLQDIKYLLKRVSNLKVIYADKGYDAEWLHEFCYWNGIKSVIKSKEWTKKGWARRIQKKNFENYNYGLRSNVESGFSAIKRKYGSGVKSKKIEGLRTEIVCKGIAHNLNLMQA